MSYTTLLLPLLLALVAIPARAQEQPGTFTFNASIPDQNPRTSGCVILAQLTETTDPPTLQAMQPICPGGTPIPSDPLDGATIHWPIAANAADGSGVKSKLVIYGQVAHKADRTDIRMAQAGCVMTVLTQTVQYLLGRSLTWNNGLQQLWDNKGNGFILNEEMNGNLPCVKDEKLLPEALWLPDPYVAQADDGIWQAPLQLAVPKPPVVEDTATSTSASASGPVKGIQTLVSSIAPSGSASASGSSSGPVIGVQITSASSAGPTSSAPVVVAVQSGSASASPSASKVVIGGDLIGLPESSSSSSAPSASASGPTGAPDPIVAIISGGCAPVTVTEIWTTTVTATVQNERRGRFHMYP